MAFKILDEREGQVARTRKGSTVVLDCNRASVAGSVSQRACTFCGSRVVLYPIADALHLVHGPIGCAAYTWDIRGALSSGPELHRISCSTDLRERDVVLGGEARLESSLRDLISRYSPKSRSAAAKVRSQLRTKMIWLVCPTVLRPNPGTTTKDFSSTNLPNRISTTKAR